MKRTLWALGLIAAAAVLSMTAGHPPEFEQHWHQWRGPYMTGFAPNADPPLEWSETKNIKWKVAIPGKGHSTPIVWGDRIILTTAIDTGKSGESESPPSGPRTGPQGMPPGRSTANIHEFVVIALSRRDGKVLWRRTVAEEKPEEATHELGSWASNSAITDGEHIYAYFGSRGLYALDMKGELKWERDFGQLRKRMEFGEGESVALYGDKLVVNWDSEGPSFIAALDKTTGKDVWKVDRDEGTSWATPYVVEVDGRPQVVTSATKLIRSYDLETGQLVWQCGGMTQNAIPTPFAADGLLYVMSGYRGNALLAIRLSGAKGDITGSEAIVWRLEKETSYAPSALLMGGHLYFLRANNGILACFEARTGREIYAGQRLDGLGNIFASPVGAGDRIYISGQQGTFAVVKAGPRFEVLAKNSLDDNFIASPVCLGNELYLRGTNSLYCVQEKR